MRDVNTPSVNVYICGDYFLYFTLKAEVTHSENEAKKWQKETVRL